MIKAKVNIETAKKMYKPGDVVTETLSKADMEFLRGHGFITEEDDGAAQADMDAEDLDGVPAEDFDSAEDAGSEAVYKDEAALKKMNKDEIVAYASGIGLELDGGALKADLVDSVLNYVEERMAD